MKRSVNKVFLMGHVGHTPTVKEIPNSTAANFQLAVSERRGGDGKAQDVTHWFSIVAYGRTADNIGKLVKRGSHVFVEGRLITRKYIGRDKTEKSVTEIIINNILVLDKKEDAGEYEQDSSPVRDEPMIDDQDIPM